MLDANQLIKELNWNREPRGLYEPIGYTLEAGGKRLRPTLALIACDMFGGNEQDVVPAALALEVFHNFTLLHDDVMDHADIRRGRPTVHIRWNENTAILSGDQMLIEAYKLLAGVPADKLPEVMRLFNKMATEICEGQQYDVDFENRDDVTLDDYIMMIRLKTSVLLATALEIGAYIAGADEEQRQLIYDYGVNIGLAFQIQDDILDVYGDPATFGKAIGGDILCNKKTYIRLVAEQKMGKWNYDNLAPKEKIAAVTAIYNEAGARKVCEDVMLELTQKALASLEKLNAPTQKKQVLRDLAAKMLARKS